MEKDNLPAGITPEMIEGWKAKFGKRVKLIDLPLDENHKEILTVAALVPDRKTLSEWEKWSDKNPDKAKDILITNCLLTGVEQVKADDALFFTCATALGELIPVRKATIRSL
jgi:hypothetical protein